MVIRTDQRKLFKAGNSIVPSIPQDFLEINDLERGNHMEVSWLGSLLQVTPVISSGKGNEVEHTEEKLIERHEQRRRLSQD